MSRKLKKEHPKVEALRDARTGNFPQLRLIGSITMPPKPPPVKPRNC